MFQYCCIICSSWLLWSICKTAKSYITFVETILSWMGTDGQSPGGYLYPLCNLRTGSTDLTLHTRCMPKNHT